MANHTNTNRTGHASAPASGPGPTPDRGHEREREPESEGESDGASAAVDIQAYRRPEGTGVLELRQSLVDGGTEETWIEAAAESLMEVAE